MIKSKTSNVQKERDAKLLQKIVFTSFYPKINKKPSSQEKNVDFVFYFQSIQGKISQKILATSLITKNQ
jgi:hypothetical protein